MSASSTDGASVFDPFGVWKQARDANLEAWSKMMIDFVNSDAYARASGRRVPCCRQYRSRNRVPT